MYGLKQADVLTYNNSVQQLAPHGYHPSLHTTGIVNMKLNAQIFVYALTILESNITLKMIMVTYSNLLKKHHKITVDWNGGNHCGPTLNCHDEKGYFKIYMPGYFKKTLQQLQHSSPTPPHYTPHR